MARAEKLANKGIDPVIRRTVIIYIVALGVLAAVLWAALLMHDPAEVAGVGVRADGTLSVTYNEQGWPIIMDSGGNVIHPEDLGRDE